jgi:hypothetical protein
LATNTWATCKTTRFNTDKANDSSTASLPDALQVVPALRLLSNSPNRRPTPYAWRTFSGTPRQEEGSPTRERGEGEARLVSAVGDASAYLAGPSGFLIPPRWRFGLPASLTRDHRLLALPRTRSCE